MMRAIFAGGPSVGAPDAKPAMEVLFSMSVAEALTSRKTERNTGQKKFRING